VADVAADDGYRAHGRSGSRIGRIVYEGERPRRWRDEPDAMLKPGGHLVENNHIHHISRIDYTYTPAVWMSGVGNRIAHNLMHDINSSAIRLNGNDHIVEFNEVHNVVLDSDDQGGADMWGDATFRGNIFRYNYWHHIGNWDGRKEELSTGQAGIRLDDAICGVRIHGNIFHRCSSGRHGFGGVQIHGGKENLIDNNIFADCRHAVSFSPWSETHWRNYVKDPLQSDAIDAELYLERYPALAKLHENLNCNTVTRNLVWKCGSFLHRSPAATIAEHNLISADDGLLPNAAQGDFTLTAIPAELRQHGFEAIPFERIGLYKDKFRKQLPIQSIDSARTAGRTDSAGDGVRDL
jgi:hypothetical protein